jgi:hypothetical protein
MANEDYWDNPVDDSSGLLGHFVGKILDPFWSNIASESQGKVSGQGSDQTQLFLNNEVVDIMQEDFGGTVPETLTISLGIGKKWWVDPENDDVVDHEDQVEGSDKQLKFHASSAYGKVLALIAGRDPEETLGEYKVLDGGGDVEFDFSGLKEYFRKNGIKDARNAKMWEGVIFEYRGLGFVYRNLEGPLRMKPFPVKFLGVGEIDGNKATTTTAPKAEEHGVVWPDATPAQSKTLNKLMASSKSQEEFVGNASMLDFVSKSDVLTAAISDPSFYKVS